MFMHLQLFVETTKRQRENDVVESQPSMYTEHHPTAEDCCNSAACGGPASIDLVS